MVNKPKSIGTAAETAVRNYLLSIGFGPHEAHRNVLSGSQDQGDVWLRHPIRGLIVFEVKGGQAAKTASHEQCEKWLRDAEIEARNASGRLGVLVTQRAGVGVKNAGKWWCYFDGNTIGPTITLPVGRNTRLETLPPGLTFRVTLAEFMAIMNVRLGEHVPA